MQTFLENYLVPLIFLVIALFSGLSIRKHMKAKKEKEAEAAAMLQSAEEKTPEEE
ncbi:MAG: hypothetical protein IJI56_04435 [Firmicutes bacterium]|nr:hypothetical protein [Bacillota bacterium]